MAEIRASTSPSLARHLFGPGPKRVLALDGGGVRGIVSLAFLERLEALLASRTGRGDSFRLSDYFDLIGGTSTGAIIATGLALGFPVAKLISIYRDLAKEAFHGARWYGGILVPKFRSEPLVATIRQFVGDTTLGSERLLTGLGIVAKRLDTASVWVFHNHPRGRFYDADGNSPAFIPNKDFPLAGLLRASTAAPSYFNPEHLEVAPGISGAFVDGGVSPHNNPALLLVMLATLAGYGFRWPLGEERLALVSIGTGSAPAMPAAADFQRMSSAMLAVHSLRSIINDCSDLTQLILQWVGHSPAPWTIDGEIGDLRDETLSERGLLHYLRYDLKLQADWLRRHLDLDLPNPAIAKLARMDRPAVVDDLLEIGRRAAARQVVSPQLPPVFDPA